MACLVQKGPNQATHEPPKAWAALSKWLPSHNTEIDYWWKVTGTPLAMMMDAAGYSLEGQYDALLSHYHWTIPYLGCAPRPDVNRQWSSIFGAQPLDYCWKWNTATTQPDVRCTMEAFNRFSGTKMDPLAQDASRELLCCLQAAMPSIDVSYVTPMSTWDEGLSRLSPGDESRIAVSEFIETNPEGKLLSPFMLGIDHVKPAQSRLKFYFQTPSTTFSSAREIMTLGGRVAISEAQFQELQSLITAVTGSDTLSKQTAAPEYDCRYKDAFANAPALRSGFVYSFDMVPGASLPHVQLHIMARHYRCDDLTVARAMTGWMEDHGRGQYCSGYLSMIEGLSPQRRLDEGKGMQSRLRCAFKENGKLDVTSYLTPEASVPVGEVASKKLVIPIRRATRRRGDGW
ncbi:dimethylallyl tryptophan synthase GliD1 [Ophiocordyceps sinensis CO18]|uniref:Dimethylallyl tryptophan synthase GliD1 n=1 Tax=Ophiocordyceps sinensis (strain Co18 / CGMCC 3.14243) TaxID=911162 RepID=T5AC75_OPHSC|nr:dimethylallyl tryptophan synthase GliD1 [Ophiocordyceps sinensis CO18]